MWTRVFIPFALVLVACAGPPEPRVSLSLRPGENVAAALGSAARVARRSIAVDPRASCMLEGGLELRDVPWPDALGEVARAYGLERRTIEAIEVLVVRDPSFSYEGDLRRSHLLPAMTRQIGVALALETYEDDPYWYRDGDWTLASTRLDLQSSHATAQRGELLLARPRACGEFEGRFVPDPHELPSIPPRADCRGPIVSLDLTDVPLSVAAALLALEGFSLIPEGPPERVSLHLVEVPAEQAVSVLAWLTRRRIAQRPAGVALVEPARVDARFVSVRMDRALEALARATGYRVALPPEGIAESRNLVLADVPVELAITAAAEVWGLTATGGPVTGWTIDAQPPPSLEPEKGRSGFGGMGDGCPPAFDSATCDALDELIRASRAGEPVEPAFEAVFATSRGNTEATGTLVMRVKELPPDLQPRIEDWIRVLQAGESLDKVENAIRDDQPKAAGYRLDATKKFIAPLQPGRELDALTARAASLEAQAARLARFLARTRCCLQGTVAVQGRAPLAVIDGRLVVPGGRLRGPDGTELPDLVLEAVEAGAVRLRLADEVLERRLD